jgi:hypothetical protein
MGLELGSSGLAASLGYLPIENLPGRRPEMGDALIIPMAVGTGVVVIVVAVAVVLVVLFVTASMRGRQRRRTKGPR